MSVIGLKSKVFVRTVDKGLRTHRAKMGKYCSLAENTQNATTFFDPICLSKPKSLGILKKIFGCPSVVN